MAKKNEKEMKKAKETKKKLLGRKEEKASRRDNRDKSERDLIRESRRVKMSEINDLSDHEKKKLEKRTDKRHARHVKRLFRLYTILSLIYLAMAIISAMYIENSVSAVVGGLIAMPILLVYYSTSRKGIFSGILSLPISIAQAAASIILCYVCMYAKDIGFSAAISSIPEIIIEIRASMLMLLVPYFIGGIILLFVLGVLVYLFDNPRKYILKHEYVKMRNGD